MTAIAAPLDAAPKLIRLHYLWFVVGAVAILIVAIMSRNIWFLNWVHVICGASWTGIDLFMGFILGPIMRSLDVSLRKEVLLRLTPRTLFLMPTLGIVTGTAGWFLAVDLGFAALPWPQVAWVWGAVGLNIAMSLQGLLYLMPTNLRVCFELQKPHPDGAKIGRMMSKYFIATAAQGTMQMAIIVIMAKFVTGI
jgi:hypothetical protein